MSRIVFIGDSNTADASTPGPENWSRVVATGLGFTDRVNLATPGRYAYFPDATAALAQSPDLVVMMIGTNDMANAIDMDVSHAARLASYLKTVTDMIDLLRDAGKPVVVLSPILSLQPRETIRFGDWCDHLRAICVALGAQFVDVWSQMVFLSATQPASTFLPYYKPADVYHLSAAGHAMLASYVLDQVQWSGAPPPPPPSGSIAYLGNAQSSENLTAYTFPAMALGTPSADRFIVVALGSRQNAVRSIAGVTVAGVSASQVVTKAAGLTEIVSCYRVALPTGSTGDVVVTFSGAMLRCAVALYAVTGGAMAHAQSASAGVNGSPVSLALDVFGGAIAAGWFNSAAGAASFSGVTMDAEVNPESTANTFATGRVWLGSNQSARVIALASSTNFNGDAVLVAASWD